VLVGGGGGAHPLSSGVGSVGTWKHGISETIETSGPPPPARWLKYIKLRNHVTHLNIILLQMDLTNNIIVKIVA